MIIDFHTHTFPADVAGKAVRGLRAASHTRPFSDGTAESLRAEAERAGIGLSVILPAATSAQQVVHINDAAIRRNEAEAAREDGEGSRLLSFGCMHPGSGNCREELARIAAAGLSGIKIHPYFSRTDLDDIRYLRILDRAAELGLIVVTHAGYDIGFPDEHFCTVQMLRSVMRAIGAFPLVAAHMGGWQEWEQVPELLADTGIYLDTSFSTGQVVPDEGQEAYWEDGGPAAWSGELLDAEMFAALVRAFPEGHVLFGTDSPWSDAEKEIAFIRKTDLPERTKEDILGGAAKRLLGQAQRPVSGTG